MGLGLGSEDVAALEERTEGWIAALQLAALSMEGRDDVADFVARFTGNDRYIVDYLVEEVLQRLPDEIHGAGRGRRLPGHRLVDWRRPRSSSPGMERVRRGARAGGARRRRTWGHPRPG